MIEVPLHTCEAVIGEACSLARRLGLDGQRKVLEFVRRGALDLSFPLEDEIDAVARLAEKYRDVPMSLADAYLVRMSEMPPDSKWNDPRAGFGSVAAMLAVDSGYVVADGRNQEIVFLDKALNPVKKIGRHGEGPGEFQFPSALTAGDDFVAVLDEGLARVYQLTADGDLLRSMQVTSDAEDLAVHSRLGVLTTGTAFPGYYLTMAHDEAPLAFGRIPHEFYPSELMASGYRARNLVAATADGMVHVLDGEHLAVVGFEEDGNRTDLVFLPHDIRAALLDRRAQRREAFGAASLGGADVTALIPLPDGRVFAVLAYEDTAGLVLDLAARQAIPIVMPPDERDWIWGSRIFDGESLVLSGEFGDITVVATRLVSQ